VRKLASTFAAALALVLGSSAYAQPELDFGLNSSSPIAGSVNYAGGATPLVGTSITANNVTGLGGTVLNNGITTAITGGVLNFTTLNNSGGWNFNGPGGASSVTITGSTGLSGGTNQLLTGTISSASVQVVGALTKVVLAVLVNSVDNALAAFYGLPLGGGTSGHGWDGALNLSFITTASVGQPITGSGNARSGDLNDFPVPELDPSSATSAMALVSGCMLMLTGRRKLNVTAGRLAA
jgi:hypothetical protein